MIWLAPLCTPCSSTRSIASLLLQSQWLMWCVVLLAVSFPTPVIETIKSTGVNIFLGPLSINIGTQVPHGWPLGSKVMSAYVFVAFLRYLKFWMGMFKVFTWIGLLILIPKLIWKVPIGHLLEQFNSDWDVLQSKRRGESCNNRTVKWSIWIFLKWTLIWDTCVDLNKI